MTTTAKIETTERGARVIIVRRPNGGHVLVRDDGHPVYGDTTYWHVADYLRRYGHAIQPSPPGRRLLF